MHNTPDVAVESDNCHEPAVMGELPCGCCPSAVRLDCQPQAATDVQKTPRCVQTAPRSPNVPKRCHDLNYLPLTQATLYVGV